MTQGEIALTDRLLQARQALAKRGLDALLITQPENRRYLSGFTGEDDDPFSPAAWLLLTQDKAVLMTFFTNLAWAKSEAPLFDIVRVMATYQATTTELLLASPVKKIGFEARYMPVAIYDDLRDTLGEGKKLIAADGLIDDLRMVKEPEEIRLITEAASIADAALADVIGHLLPGQTEIEIAWKLEKYMREHGAEGIAFETIVASGPNSALPHYRSGQRPIQRGEPLLIDMGAKVHGYRSDITRTFVYGEPTMQFTQIYEIALEALEAAETAARPGMTGRELDNIAREIIIDAGYGDNFGHGLGHGVGLAIHERPRVGKSSDDALAPNMVVTIEPGIYIPDWGGVRIEDTVVIRPNGVEVLTKTTKTFTVAPR
jgi:Xaa-Pro aminopeptidase